MPVERMLPQQQQHSPDVIQPDAPISAKVFGITTLGFKSFDELIHKSAQEYGVEFELFFSNSLGTQHGWMKLINGKVMKTIPLLEISVSYSQPVIQAGTKIGYIIKYYHTTMSDTAENFISYVMFDKHKVGKRLNVPPQGSKSKDELCEKLVETLIIEKAEGSEPIEIGVKQGWCLLSEINALWESRRKYPTVLQNIIPESIAGRETPRIRKALFKKEHSWDRAFNEIFDTWPDLKVPFLIRESSYMLTFSGKYGISFNQIINFKNTDMADSSLWTAMFDNVSYGHGSVLSLSSAKNIERASKLLNDSVLLVVDDTNPDESKKREDTIGVLQRRALDSKSDFCQVPVVVSCHASTQMRPDLYIDFSGYDGSYDISQAVLMEVLESHDTRLIERIQKEYCEFIELFNANIEEISKQTPYMIPAQRRNAYYILVATMRTYDEFFGVFFDEETELRLVDILSSYNEVGESNDELLPAEVVDAMFEFIDLTGGKKKLPVNLLFVGDCSGLPAKKRRIVGFIKAIAGKLDKDETRALTGIISDMLKRNPKVSSLTTDMLRTALKRGGKVGNHVFSLVSSTLDDIDTIGFEERGWAEFFEKTKKIPVLSFGNESGDKVHSLLDALISSAFEWQRDHDTAPLTVVVDEIKDQNFTEGSPLHTILTQGRKFNTKFVGMTQHYISTTSHAIDVAKEAGIKIFFKPAKSLERIATELGYKNPVDAGFGSMGIGDIILSAELFNKVDGVNEPVVIHAKAIKFIDTPLFEQFQKEYDIK